MSVEIKEEKIVESSAPAASETPDITTSSDQTPEPVKVESSPAVKKAREAMEKAKNGTFEGEKEEKTAKEAASKEEAKVDEKAASKTKTGENLAKTEVKPEYKANYKYKVGGKELEFDEAIKGLIKDEATEAKVRQLYADAAGLGPLKNQLEQKSQQHMEVAQKFAAIDKDLRLLSHHLNNQDFDSFFKDLKISEDQIFQWVQKKLAESELPPMQQAELARNREAQRQAFLLQEENQGFRQQQEQQMVQARTYELDMELMKPEVSQIAQDFDARVGRVGAFRDECMNRGALAWQFTKKDISAAEAVQQQLAIIGRVVAPPQAPQITPPQTGVTPPAQAASQSPNNTVIAPPVMPNIGGRSTSPVKTPPRSVADLRKLGKQFAASTGQ